MNSVKSKPPKSITHEPVQVKLPRELKWAKSTLPTSITHEPVQVMFPRALKWALVFEAGRTGKSMGDVLLDFAQEQLDKLPRDYASFIRERQMNPPEHLCEVSE